MALPSARISPRLAARQSLPAPVLQARGTRRIANHRGRAAGPVAVRADVNWDAFRSTVEHGFVPGAPGTVKRAPAAAPPTNSVTQVDFLVIGSGIAGLSYALKVAPYGTVAVVTKDFANEGCTQYAQGGVCAVLDKTDSVQEHVRDTIVAGAFLNDPQAVEVVCREGPARVLELVQMGTEFTRNNDGSLHLTKEGGHSKRRVVHAADLTGREIERALLATARAHPNIRFYEHHLAIDLVTDEYEGVPHCFGADVLDQRTQSMTRFIALSTMLACGGAGQVFPNTTNPHVATGDGIAMAYRAAATVSNMEFVQFHPTALWDPTNTGRTFLITEAVRGEGGILRNLAGERFMSRYDEKRMELAPRDVVARAIHNELMERGDSHVLLDISHKPADEVLHHFPNIAAKCAELGIDITRQPIPVVPAQHYTCGGVQTGLLGETNVQGLYACGEVACSGLHGANRLASNSLLEGLVFADRAAGPSVAHAEHALRNCGRQLHYAAASTNFQGPKGARALGAQQAAWAREKRAHLRDLMWRYCGIVRRTAELQTALESLGVLRAEAKAALKAHGVCTELVELFNLATVAEITVACALQRHESRGGHFCADYPQEVEEERRPSLVSKAAPGSRRAAPAPAPAVFAPATGSGASNAVPGPAGSVKKAGVVVQGGAAAGAPAGPKKKAGAKVQRDMAVRSMPEGEDRR